MQVAPTRNIWIHENLADEARRLWELGKAQHPPNFLWPAGP